MFSLKWPLWARRHHDPRRLDPFCRPGPEGPARAGQDQPFDLLGAAAVETLENGAVLGVDRNDRDIVCFRLTTHERARHHHHFFVRQADRPTRANRRQYRLEAHRADETGDDQIRGLRGDRLEPSLSRDDEDLPGRRLGSERLTDGRHVLRITDRHDMRSKTLRLLDQSIDAATRRQGDDVEALGVGSDNVQGLLADAPGAAEDRETLHLDSEDPDGAFTCALVRPNRRSRR